MGYCIAHLHWALKVRQNSLQIVPRCGKVAWPAGSARLLLHAVHCSDMSSDKATALLFLWVVGKVYQAGTCLVPSVNERSHVLLWAPALCMLKSRSSTRTRNR